MMAEQGHPLCYAFIQSADGAMQTRDRPLDAEDPLLQIAISAIEAGDFEASFTMVKKLAGRGDALAQHFLGWHYHKGLGVQQDDTKAAYWWRKAADLGIGEAQQGLGWAYEHGRGVTCDLLEAYRWYSEAIRSGDVEARESLSALSGKLSSAQIKLAEGL